MLLPPYKAFPYTEVKEEFTCGFFYYLYDFIILHLET